MLSHTVLGTTWMPEQGEAERLTLARNRILIQACKSGYSINERVRVLKDVRCGPHRICIIDHVALPTARFQLPLDKSWATSWKTARSGPRTV